MVWRWGEESREGGAEEGCLSCEKTWDATRVFTRSVGRGTLGWRAAVGLVAQCFGFKMALTGLPWCAVLVVCMVFAFSFRTR